jgi:hypothetical protein
MNELFNLSYGSCGPCEYNPVPAHHWISNVLRSRAFTNLGDAVYTTSSGAGYGGFTNTAILKSTNPADFQAHYDQLYANPSVKLTRDNPNILYMHIQGDHERGGNDWDHTTSTANDGGGGNFTTQKQVNDHWIAGYDNLVMQESTIDPGRAGNRPYNDNRQGVKFTSTERVPPTCNIGDTPDPTKYVPLGFSIGFDKNGNVDNVNPYVEQFTIDAFTCIDTEVMVDGPTKTKWGGPQKAAVLARLAATTATYKIICSPGPMTYIRGPADPWSYEIESIYDELEAQTGWNVPGGVLIVSGDIHASMVFKHLTYDIYEFIGSPMTSILTLNTPWTWDLLAYPTVGVPWPGADHPRNQGKAYGTTSQPKGIAGFVTVHIYDGLLKATIRSSDTGHELCAGYLNPGTNAMHFHQSTGVGV